MILEYMNLEFLAVIMAAMVLYLFYYIFTKDAHYSRQVRSIATVVEEANKEIFYLKQQLTNIKKHGVTPAVTEGRMSDDEIYQEIERSTYDMLKPISMGLKKLEENLIHVDNTLNSRISMLESGVKQISIPSSIHNNDDEKIISLYKTGVALETIAKELHISKAEVEFVLKINKIK